MVIKDSQYSDMEHAQKAMESGNLKHSQEELMATPTDRLASFVIDYFIILMPILYLVAAPFQRMIREAALVNDNSQITIASILGSILIIVFILLYQILCTWKWQATPGQKILGLYIKNIWPDKEISFSQAVSRTLYWTLSILMLGIPFLSIFTNFKRRALHERISDTQVLVRKFERRAKEPSLKEQSLARGVYWMVGFIIFMLIGTAVLGTLSRIKKQAGKIAILEENDSLCPIVSDAQSDWPEENGKEPERLSVAMALYAAGTIDRKCLQFEVENLYTAEDDSALLNLAKSFVYSDHRDLSDQYLAKVCAYRADSDECHISRVVDAVSVENWPEVNRHFAALKPTSAVYASIWAVRQYMRRDEYENAEKFIKRIPDLKEIADFSILVKTKTLWALHKTEEASGLEQAAYASINEDAKVEIASFMCFEKIWSDCAEVKSQSCKQFDQLVTVASENLQALKPAMTYLKMKECENKNNLNYEEFLSSQLNENVRSLAQALSVKGTDGFNELLDREDQDEDFANEVSRRMVERTQNRGLLGIISKDWREGRHTLSWQKLGITLFQKLYRLNAYNESLQVANLLNISNDKNSKNILEEAIIAASRVGQKKQALEWLKKYVQINPLPQMFESSNRSPASMSPFLEVARELLVREGI